MLVGEFPGMNQINRRTVRAPANPMDKCTIVSIFPKWLRETKSTVQPGYFEIPPGSFEKPSILIVGTSSWWKEIDEHQPLLEIPVSSIQVADAVVNDYCNCLLASNAGDQKPGIFYIPGEHTQDGLKKDHMPLLLDAQAKQKKWFMEIIRLSDIMWSRSNGNPLSISDDARLACKQLNITNKPWLGDLQTAELVRCVACGALRDALFPICRECKAISDPELAKKLNLTFAK